MEILILKQEIVDKILNDQVLFGKVAKALDMKVRTAFDRIKENKPDIATASSLNAIAAHLSEKTGNEVQISELTEQMHTVA